MNHRGKLIEVRHQLQELGIFMDSIAFLFRVRPEVTLDFVQPLRRADDYPIGAKLLLVIRKAPNTYGLRPQKTVTAGHVPCGNSAERKFQGLAVEES